MWYTAGARAFAQNEIDIAIIAVPVGKEVPRDEFRIYPFAYDVAIIAVNSNNPLTELSLSDLAGIYGSNEKLQFQHWGDLGCFRVVGRNIKPMAAPMKNVASHWSS